MENSVIQRIELIRQDARITQAAFARRIRITQSYYSRLVSKDRPVNDRIVSLICSEFGANEVWIKTGVGERYTKKKVQIEEEFFERFVKNSLSKLQPEFRAYFERVCQQFIDEERIKARREDEALKLKKLSK